MKRLAHPHESQHSLHETVNSLHVHRSLYIMSESSQNASRVSWSPYVIKSNRCVIHLLVHPAILVWELSSPIAYEKIRTHNGLPLEQCSVGLSYELILGLVCLAGAEGRKPERGKISSAVAFVLVGGKKEELGKDPARSDVTSCFLIFLPLDLGLRDVGARKSRRNSFFFSFSLVLSSFHSSFFCFLLKLSFQNR